MVKKGQQLCHVLENINIIINMYNPLPNLLLLLLLFVGED